MPYLRFVIPRLDDNSGRRQGLFQAMANLAARHVLDTVEAELYEQTRAWFGRHLKAPRRFARSTRPHAKYLALSWFKDSAREHIARMRQMASILESHGIVVEVLYSEKPGYIVYEDEYQVAAEPFNETGA